MMNASITPSVSVLHAAFDLRKIGEGLTKMGSYVNNLNVNYEDLLQSVGIFATDVMGVGLRHMNRVFSDHLANYA